MAPVETAEKDVAEAEIEADDPADSADPAKRPEAKMGIEGHGRVILRFSLADKLAGDDPVWDRPLYEAGLARIETRLKAAREAFNASPIGSVLASRRRQLQEARQQAGDAKAASANADGAYRRAVESGDGDATKAWAKKQKASDEDARAASAVTVIQGSFEHAARAAQVELDRVIAEAVAELRRESHAEVVKVRQELYAAAAPLCVRLRGEEKIAALLKTSAAAKKNALLEL